MPDIIQPSYSADAGESPLIVPPASCVYVSGPTAYFLANYFIMQRFTLPTYRKIRYLNYRIGTASGNVQVGVVKLTGAQHKTWATRMDSGVIACPTAGAVRQDFGATVLEPGEYAAFFWADNTTVQVSHGNLASMAASRWAAVQQQVGGVPTTGTVVSWTGDRTFAGLTLEGDY